MNTRKIFAFAIAASTLPLALTAPAVADEGAARLLRIQGEVLITRANGSVKGAEGGMLRIGDRLMALEGGQALIRFTDGCTYALNDDEIFTVAEASPCASGLTSKVEAQGLTGGAAAAKGGLVQTGVPMSALPAIAAGVVGVVAIAYDSDDDDDDERRAISP